MRYRTTPGCAHGLRPALLALWLLAGPVPAALPRAAAPAVSGTATSELAAVAARLASGEERALEVAWETDLESALLRSAAEGKPVLLFASMAGCAPCRMLETTTFEDRAVRQRLRGFIPVRLDVRENAVLAARLRIDATPTLVILSSRGEERGRLSGFLPPADLLAALADAMSDRRAVADDEQARAVRAVLGGGAVRPEQWPTVLAALGDERHRRELMEHLLALRPLPRRELVALLESPQLAVRLGALDVLEQAAGDDFGFDPWRAPDTDEIADARTRWQEWAADTNAAPVARYAALTREQAEARLQDLLGDDRDREQRARRQFLAAGPLAAELVTAYAHSHTNLAPGLVDRLREVRYATLLQARSGFDPARQAQRLVHGNLDVQLQALRELKPQGRRAWPILEDHLVHANPLVREAAAEVLLVSGKQEALPRLTRLLEQEANRDVVITVARGLGAVRVRAAAPMLAGLLQREDEDIVIAALQSLARLEAASQGEAIVRCLRDPRWRVRVTALQAVGKMQLQEAYEAVEQRLEDEDAFVRFTAVLTLPKVNRGDQASKRLIRSFLADDALKPPVAAALAELNKPLPTLCLEALNGRPTEVILAVFDAYEKDASRAVPLALRFAAHAEDDLACVALKVLALNATTSAEAQPPLLAAMRDGNRARVLAVLENLHFADPDSGDRWSSGENTLDDMLAELQTTAAVTPAAPGPAPTGELADLFAAFAEVPPAPQTATPSPAAEAPAAAPAAPAVTVNDLFSAFDATQAVAMADVTSLAPPAEAAPAQATNTQDLVAAARACAQRFAGDAAVEGAVDLVRLQARDTNALADVEGRVARLADDARAEAATYLGRTASAVGRAQLVRMLSDPNERVRERAVAALGAHLADEAWCADLFGAFSATGLHVRISWLPEYEIMRQIRRAPARDNVRRWARDFAARGDRPPLAGLGCVLLETCGQKGDATNLVALTASDDRFVRRCAYHALARLDAAHGLEWLKRAAADPAHDVREVVPAMLAEPRLSWTHRVTEEEALGAMATGRVTARELTAGERELLDGLAKDAVAELRVHSRLALFSRGAPFDAAALMEDLAACADPAETTRVAANVFEQSYRRLKSPAPALLPLIEEASTDDGTREAMLRKVAGPGTAAAEPAAAAPAFRPADAPADTAAAEPAGAQVLATNVLRAVFFSERGCEACENTRELLKALQDTFPELAVAEHEIAEAGAERLNAAWCEHFHVPERLRHRTPAVFASAGWLVGDAITFDELAELLARSLDVPHPRVAGPGGAGLHNRPGTTE